MNLKALVEAVIFASRGITAERISSITGKSVEEIRKVLEEIKNEFSSEDHGVELVEIDGHYRFYTKPIYSDYVAKITRKRFDKLSDSQLEIVAILLVNGPLTKSEIDSFRGRDSSAILSSLYKMGVVRRKRKGRSYLYELSKSFKETTMIEETLRKFLEKSLKKDS
ncbi:MAG TPA: SMC-Scp complex subunit ScpB [Thermotoga sp.]|nr:SMC-Scp complex subunit ScpB [Thermotoga sp.]